LFTAAKEAGRRAREVKNVRCGRSMAMRKGKIGDGVDGQK